MEDREMSIVEHIVELRKRLIITVLSFIVFLIVGFVFTKDIYFWLVKRFTDEADSSRSE